MPNITVRSFSQHAYQTLHQSGLPPVLARIYAARGIEQPQQLETELSQLHPIEQLTNVSLMASLLADAIAEQKRILIVADYDSDGATACAVAIRALRKFGAMVDYLVPNRFEYGYGLTPEIVRLAVASAARQPDILLTVDNGIASVEGVREANHLGMQVFITDHHLPGDQLPTAAVIVNPNQAGCNFPSKHLAGVGVIFYVMLALRAELRKRGAFITAGKEPNLASLLDLVALGTVADVVRLDSNNRILVQRGLQRICKEQACAGINALLQVAKRNYRQASTYDLGFILGPRLNAAGRLDDMTMGIECLITDDESKAGRLASQLDELNRQRREIEAEMQNDAWSKLATVIDTQPSVSETAYSLCLYDPCWHQGVVGLLASRIKEKYHRPVIIFAPGNEGEIKGSGRSIPGLHLRDALDLVSKRYPGLILKFGGHAAAAGLTVAEQSFEDFRTAFEQITQALLTPADLTRVIETDGELDDADLNLDFARYLADCVWGQGFPEPSFNAHFYVENQRVVGEKHLKLKLKKFDSCCSYDAMLFFQAELLPPLIHAVFRVQVNEYNGNTTLQLLLEHWSQSDAMI